MSITKPCGLSMETTSGDSSCQFQAFSSSLGSPGAADVARCSVRIAFFVQLSNTLDRCRLRRPWNSAAIAPSTPLLSNPLTCPLRERDVTVLQCMQGRSIIKGFAEH